MKLKKIIAVTLAMVIALLAFTSCSGNGSGGGDINQTTKADANKLEEIQNRGKLVAYTDPNFPPFEFKRDNKIVGVDMELAQAIADELGVTLEIKEGGFDSLLIALQGGKGDIVISGMTIKEERKKNADFSEPYINSVQYLILREDSELATMEDLKDKKVGAASGYTGALIIDDEINEGVLKGSKTTLKTYPSAMEATLDLKNKKVEAVIMDEYVAKNIVSTNSGIKAVKVTYQNGEAVEDPYGVAVKKGNPELLAKINDVIAKLNKEEKVKEWLIEYSK